MITQHECLVVFMPIFSIILSMASDIPHFRWVQESKQMEKVLQDIGTAVRTGQKELISELQGIVCAHVLEGNKLCEKLDPEASQSDDAWNVSIKQEITKLLSSLQFQLRQKPPDNDDGLDGNLREGPPLSPVPMSGPSSSSSGAAVEVAVPKTKTEISTQEELESYGYIVRKIPDKRGRAA